MEVFAGAGFETVLCPWRYKDNAVKFVEYAKAHDGGNIRGVMETTWCDPAALVKLLLEIPAGEDVPDNCKYVAETYRTLFM